MTKYEIPDDDNPVVCVPYPKCGILFCGVQLWLTKRQTLRLVVELSKWLEKRGEIETSEE